MTTCTVTPTVTVPLGTRFLEALFRFFSHAPVSRDSVDQAWLESGLGRLDAGTLKDIGAPAHLSQREQLKQAWKLAAALDATRHL